MGTLSVASEKARRKPPSALNNTFPGRQCLPGRVFPCGDLKPRKSFLLWAIGALCILHASASLWAEASGAGAASVSENSRVLERHGLFLVVLLRRD